MLRMNISRQLSVPFSEAVHEGSGWVPRGRLYLTELGLGCVFKGFQILALHKCL